VEEASRHLRQPLDLLRSSRHFRDQDLRLIIAKKGIFVIFDLCVTHHRRQAIDHPSPITITIASSRTMRSATAPILLIASIIALLAPSSSSFSSQATRQYRLKSLVVVMSATEQQQQPHHPHCDLPGDPSLFLTTNVDLGENKGAIMKELSSLVATVTRKPEAYVGE